MLAAIGPFRLDIAGLPAREIGRSSGARLAAHDIVGRAPLLEFTGPATETLTIDATLFPRDITPAGPATLAALRTACRTGQALMMVLATGEVVGRVAIETVEGREAAHDSAGRPQTIGVRLTLKETGGRTGQGLAALTNLF